MIPLLHARPLALVALAAALLAGPAAAAQKLLDKDMPPQDAANDPYTRGGREDYLEKAGYASMGGFEFGQGPDDTDSIDTFFEDNEDVQIRWIETEHFELGFALEGIKVTQAEKKKIRAECGRLSKKLFKVPKKPSFLDPWLRAHIYAQRLEDQYDRIVEFLDLGEVKFLEKDQVWVRGMPYWGNGPHLGQNGKYEVLILPTESAYTGFMRNRVGLTTRLTQRWNFSERDTLSTLTHIQQEEMRVDEALHGHIVSCVTQCMLNGFRHYSYDKPVWILEGCCHWFERDLNPRFNSSTSSEGGAPVKVRKELWSPEVAKLVKGGKAPSLATLTKRSAFAELDRADHLCVWSMVDYLREEHPGFLAKYFRAISGLKNGDGIDDPEALPDAQRGVFKEELGMTYAQFDAAWRDWASEAKRGK
ncbi:MAG: hypothetical protein AAFP22_09525 [Planctomycetota bacterium]